jgi:hypothetical protein
MFKMSCVLACALCGRRVGIVDNIFINNYTLDECTYFCITYYITAHPDDGQTRPKYVGATNWENIYHLCILLVFISNYTTMNGVEHHSNSGCANTPQCYIILTLSVLLSERTYHLECCLFTCFSTTFFCRACRPSSNRI